MGKTLQEKVRNKRGHIRKFVKKKETRHKEIRKKERKKIRTKLGRKKE